jgi:hypothetical protein
MRRLATLAVVTVVSWGAAATFIASAVDAAPADVFAATAAASGVRVSMEVPNAPATDTPIDGGGPTAQASLSSVGESIGFAAFPDPGGLVISAPGLIAGLSQAPVAPPEYPLFVRSDATTNPSATAGAGPYALSATSDATSSRASATGGLASDPAGSVSTVSSIAGTSAEDGRVVSTATTAVTGLAVGPLTVSQIRSTAQLVQNRDGTRTPTSDLHLQGLSVGGTPIDITPDGLDVADGATIPLPVGPAATQVLQAQDITVDVLGVTATDGTVVSPALRIRFPAPTPDGGTAVTTIVIGNSVASLTSTLRVPVSTGGPAPVVAPGGGVPAPGVDLSGNAALPVTGEVPVASPGDVAPVGVDQAAATVRTPPQFAIDVSGLYLVCALAIAVVFVMSQLIRLVGVRSR